MKQVFYKKCIKLWRVSLIKEPIQRRVYNIEVMIEYAIEELKKSRGQRRLSLLVEYPGSVIEDKLVIRGSVRFRRRLWRIVCNNN